MSFGFQGWSIREGGWILARGTEVVFASHFAISRGALRCSVSKRIFRVQQHRPALDRLSYTTPNTTESRSDNRPLNLPALVVCTLPLLAPHTLTSKLNQQPSTTQIQTHMSTQTSKQSCGALAMRVCHRMRPSLADLLDEQRAHFTLVIVQHSGPQAQTLSHAHARCLRRRESSNELLPSGSPVDRFSCRCRWPRNSCIYHRSCPKLLSPFSWLDM